MGCFPAGRIVKRNRMGGRDRSRGDAAFEKDPDCQRFGGERKNEKQELYRKAEECTWEKPIHAIPSRIVYLN